MVLTADHGEQFLDHGGWEHGSNVHDELIRVPLVIQTPDAGVALVDAQVQLVDLFPTLLEAAGAPIPDVAGRSLAVLRHGTTASRPAMSEIYGSQYALRNEGFKLIAFTAGPVQLFDLAADPREAPDIAAAQPARVERMRAQLDRLRARALESGRGIPTQTAPVDPAIAERLRALGYTQRH